MTRPMEAFFTGRPILSSHHVNTTLSEPGVLMPRVLTAADAAAEAASPQPASFPSPARSAAMSRAP